MSLKNVSFLCQKPFVLINVTFIDTPIILIKELNHDRK